MIPPKPAARARRVSLWRYLRLFRQDILSAQPEHLYRAWMAEFRTPFFRSYMINDPALIRQVLNERPDDFPKSKRVTEGLRLLLGQSVFVTNGAQWQRQRRIIDPAFEGGRLRDTYPAMLAAADAAVVRLGAIGNGTVEIEAEASHAAADIIFRTLFSIPRTSDRERGLRRLSRPSTRSADPQSWGVFTAAEVDSETFPAGRQDDCGADSQPYL